MKAQICWTGLITIGLVCGITFINGICQNRREISSATITIDIGNQVMTAAAQRYVANRSSHWKDAILTR